MDGNAAIVRRAIEEAYSRRNPSIISEVISSEFVRHATGAEIRGVEELEDTIEHTLAAFPDFHMEIEEMIESEDKVATRYTASGTHKGAWLGVPATGKRVSWVGIFIHHIANDRIVEGWHCWDRSGVRLQLEESSHSEHEGKRQVFTGRAQFFSLGLDGLFRNKARIR